MSKIPTKIIPQIASHLSDKDFVSACLVQKSWNHTLTPTLYSSVTLKKEIHIEPFVHLCARNPSTTAYIKSFRVLHSYDGKGITESGLESLKQIVPRLCQLQELTWELEYIPKDLEIFESFQSQCPLLHSVQLKLPDTFNLTTPKSQSQYTTLLGFKDLVGFKFNLCSPPLGIGFDLFEPIRTLLLQSPRLEVLALYFSGNSWPKAPCTLHGVLISLGTNLDLPSLRELHIRGTTALRANGSSTDPFKDFLSRYPLIESLSLDTEAAEAFEDVADPGQLTLYLPSLKRFSGPDFICDQLIRSPLAKQLQYLEPRINPFDLGLSLLPGEDYSACSLPMLRELNIDDRGHMRVMAILSSLLPISNGLEKLTLPLPPDYIHEATGTKAHGGFITLLPHAPNLQECRMEDIAYYMEMSDSIEFGRKWREDPSRRKLVEEIKQLYPRLKLTGCWV